MPSDLVNFIIRILCHFTTTCSSVEAFETTCCSDIADFGHYEIHLIVRKEDCRHKKRVLADVQ